MTTEAVSAGAVESSTAPSNESANTEVAAEGKNVSESKPEASEAESPKNPSKFKVKVDGREEDVDVDELMASYSKVKAANKRFEEAAAERKAAAAEKAEAARLKEAMKSDPWTVLKEFGVDSRKAAEDFLIEQLKLEQMTPEQKEAMELKRKLKEYEEREAQIKAEAEEKQKKEQEESEKAELLKMTEEFTKEYENEFEAALSGSKLPRKPEIIAKMAEKMYEAELEGYRMTAKQAAVIVEREIKALKAALLDGLDADSLAEFLGEENLKKVRKRDVEKLKNPVAEPQKRSEEPKPKKDIPKSPDEWLRDIKRQHGLRN
jgi:hypothetical protein